MNHQKPLSVLICALGGEGGGVLTQWMVDAARLEGYPAQATSIPGVAQRTGATTYYLEIFPQALQNSNEQSIVFGLNPLPGQLDLLISSELLEAARQVSNAMSSKSKTMVISSTGRVLTTAEKMQMQDGRVDSKHLIALIEQFSHTNYFVDMLSLSQQASTVISSVMLGCIAASGLLPMSAEAFKQVIGDQSPSQKASLKGFNLGFEALQNQKQQLSYLSSVLNDMGASTQSAQALETHDASLPIAQRSKFPLALHEHLGMADERLKHYQDRSYADLFLTRLERIYNAEMAVDAQSLLVTQESLKRLAVLMCFDDLIQVARLKLSAARFHRIAKEVKLGESDLLKIYDHFKPGVEELAALLPKTLAKGLLSWHASRLSKGLSPLALPIKLASHSIHGALMLKFLVACKPLRTISSRFQDEQALIDSWVDDVVNATERSLALGLEVAKCANLIKGYGSTHERSRENFNHILRHVFKASKFENPEDCAKAISVARSTAMKDEGGQAFDQTMQGLGLPQRAPRYQPIRWMSKSEMSKNRLN